MQISWLLLICRVVKDCHHFPLSTYIIATNQGNHIQHGLRTPREVIVFKNPKFLGLGRKNGPTIFEAYGVFSANLSAPMLVLRVPAFSISFY